MSSPLRLFSLCITAVILLGGCASSGPPTSHQSQMPETPITDQPSGKVYPGKFIWHDLLTHEPKKAGQFYQDLFGWAIEYQPHYALIRNGGKLIAGIVTTEGVTTDSSGEKVKGGLWLPTVSVADIDATACAVTANGGKILNGPFDMGQRGQALLIRDPQQSDLVVLSAKGGDPADADPAVGDWLWNELWSKDPEAIEPFYAAVFGYDQVLSNDDYSVFLHSDKWRAGIRHIRDNTKHLLWVPVVRVADTKATTKRVSELGGTVHINAGEVPGNPDIALIADTVGTLLLIQRWPAQTEKKAL